MLNPSNIDHYLSLGIHQKDWYIAEVNNLKTILSEFSDYPIIRVFAVTSMTTSIEANVHLAIKALIQWRENKPFTGFLPNQITYLNLIREGKDVPGIKIMSFIKALEGDENSVVVDIWMCRAFQIIRKRKLKGRIYFLAPTKKEYKEVSEYIRKDCIRVGLTPRQYQAAVWTGIKSEQGFFKNVSWHSLCLSKRGLLFSY